MNEAGTWSCVCGTHNAPHTNSCTHCGKVRPGVVPVQTEEEKARLAKRHRTNMQTGWGCAGIVVLFFVVASITGIGSDSKKDTETRAPVVDVTSEVVYNLGGTASSADITIETPTGTSQQTGVDVPLTTKSGGTGLHFTFPSGHFVYISAQNQDGGEITCSIVSDGATVSENTASGQYAIATCKGSAL